MDTEKDREVIHKLLDLVSVQLPTPMLLSKGAGSEELFDALIPFAARVDMLASKVDYGTVILPLVIFADQITPRVLRRRMGEFLDLAGPLTQFGPRLSGQPQGNVGRLFPLLVYFDPTKALRARKALLPDGWQPFMWEHLFLRIAVVSVGEKTVDWAEKTGLAKAGERILGFLGMKADGFKFDSSDLAAVGALDEISAKKLSQGLPKRAVRAGRARTPRESGQ
jgi:hypothetical protein